MIRRFLVAILMVAIQIASPPFRAESKPIKQFWCLIPCLNPIYNLQTQIRKATEDIAKTCVGVYHAIRIFFDYVILYPIDTAYVGAAKPYWWRADFLNKLKKEIRTFNSQ